MHSWLFGGFYKLLGGLLCAQIFISISWLLLPCSTLASSPAFVLGLGFFFCGAAGERPGETERIYLGYDVQNTRTD